MTAAVPVYRSIMLEVERRRLSLGWSMERMSEIAGLADRAYAKALYPETKAGRVARWETLQIAIDCLFPDGYDIEIRARRGSALDALAARYRIKTAAAHGNPRNQRELMRELGKKGHSSMLARRGRQASLKGAKRGGKSRARSLSRERRTAIAKMGAKQRWSTPQIVEIIPDGKSK